MTDISLVQDRRDPVVPKIDDETLAALQARFTPLVMKEGRIWTFKEVDPRRTAFTWDPKVLEDVTAKFIAARDVQTDHLCGYHAFFKPSIAEVLAQVPDDMPADVNAYLIRTDTVDTYPSGSGHRATTCFGTLLS